MQDQARHFAGPYRFELVPGSSHFLQREQPQAVTRLVLDRSPGTSRHRHAGLMVTG
jgi:pimeloyl-ACP methyl ester carboxylesterase